MEAGNNKRSSSHNSNPLSSSSSHVAVNGSNKEIAEDWNNLPEEILTSILNFLPSIADLASAASVSHLWNAAAVASSNSELALRRPPLIFMSDKSDRVPHSRCNLISIEAAAPSKYYRNSVISFGTHANANSVCAGRHFSKLILIDGSFIILHDVFTEEQIRSPRIASLNGMRIDSATLTAPLHSSSLSLVLVVVKRSSDYSPNYYVFSWEPNGSGDKDREFVVDGKIESFALFKDQVYCIDFMKRVGVVEFEPNPKVSWKQLGGDMFKKEVCYSDFNHRVPRVPKLTLVECDGELLIAVIINRVCSNYENYVKAVVYKIDLDIWKCVKKEKLSNWCLFIDFGKTGFSCKNPEIWGGRSNCIYVAGSGCKNYTICPLSYEIGPGNNTWFWPWFLQSFELAHCVFWPSPIWVYPSIKSMGKVESGKAHLKCKKVKQEEITTAGS